MCLCMCCLWPMLEKRAMPCHSDKTDRCLIDLEGRRRDPYYLFGRQLTAAELPGYFVRESGSDTSPDDAEHVEAVCGTAEKMLREMQERDMDLEWASSGEKLKSLRVPCRLPKLHLLEPRPTAVNSG